MDLFDTKVLPRVHRAGDDCWTWSGPHDDKGYARVSIQGQLFRVYRLMYERQVAAIPAGLVIDHLCRNKPCVNPQHLEAVTSRENTLRGIGPSAIHAAKTHCPQGHPYAGENLYIRPSNGSRHCRECSRAYQRTRIRIRDRRQKAV